MGVTPWLCTDFGAQSRDGTDKGSLLLGEQNVFPFSPQETPEAPPVRVGMALMAGPQPGPVLCAAWFTGVTLLGHHSCAQ